MKLSFPRILEKGKLISFMNFLQEKCLLLLCIHGVLGKCCGFDDDDATVVCMCLQVAEAAAATREEEREARMNKSPSDFSCQSYEMFVGGQGAPPEGRSSLAGGGPGGGNGHGCGADGDYSIREKMSIKSDDVDSLLGGGNVSDSRMKINGRVRKVN